MFQQPSLSAEGHGTTLCPGGRVTLSHQVERKSGGSRPTTDLTGTREKASNAAYRLQSGWGVDAQRMQGWLDRFRGTTTHVPQCGVIWVFALER